MASQASSSVPSCSLVFYKQSQFPQSWDASPEGKRSDNIQSLILALMKSPLFGTGPYLGPRYYTEGGLRQVSFHTQVCDEPVFFWDKDTKQEGVTEPDKIIIRGAQLVERKWVVYYSMPDHPTTLYGILYEIFQQNVKIHPPQSTSSKQYEIVIGGPELTSAMEKDPTLKAVIPHLRTSDEPVLLFQ